MESFDSRIAVVTGGGSGMGRELVRQLAADGCDVATCDVSDASMEETVALARAGAPDKVRLTTRRADVSEPADLVAFRQHVKQEFGTDRIDLLFNNAGIGGGGSLVLDPIQEWDRVFAICWGGVYHGTRTFLPMLRNSDRAHLVNTSSVNGFWASLGPEIPHTAYSAAKFAVKGFSEALITDLRLNAPNVQVHVVMPGHIGTSIAFNSGAYFGRHPKELSHEAIDEIRVRSGSMGVDLSVASDEDIRNLLVMRAEDFRDKAPTTAAEAATIILDGVRSGVWRILVGNDAAVLDNLVRSDPERAYERSFIDDIYAAGHLQFTQR
jgi:NAD(P)-dependent dehydrogenase (short-subunit alcohol dehydrogenase family)